jgi:hypothetical protein
MFESVWLPSRFHARVELVHLAAQVVFSGRRNTIQAAEAR